jgi:hypothetical protein
MKMSSKIFGSSIAVAAALALGATTTQAQNLVNGGFENAGGFTANPITVAGVNQGWATFLGGGSFSGQTNMFSSPDSPLAGGNALLESLNPGNNWNPAGAYQIITGITPGQTYTFSIWGLTDTGNAGYATGILVQLGFEDAALSGANSVENPGGTVGINGNFPALDTWTKYSVSATAPAGTTDAIVYAMFQDNNSAVGVENLYFDSASLTVAPEPSTLALLGMGLAAPFFFRRRKV